MTNKHSVAIVIPNWNGRDLIAACLQSLVDQSCSLPIEIVVVDNGSIDDSVALITKDFPRVHLITVPENLGFAGGVNVGIRYALEVGHEYIALFNNDALADKMWLQELVSALEQHKEVGIVTGKFLSLDKKHFDSAGEVFHTWGVPSARGRNELDQGQYDRAEFVFGATGGASLFRSQLFSDIGLFDEVFFAYYEDSDVSFRAQLAGWKVYYQPTAEVYHHMNATSARIKGFHSYQTMKNQPQLFWKNIPGRLVPGCLARFSVIYVIGFIGMVKIGNGTAAVRGVVAALGLLPHSLVARRHIQSSRKVSTHYIRSIMTPSLPPGVHKLERLLGRSYV